MMGKMDRGLKKYAVIVAGGSGLRMGTSVPKQFLLLQGKPVLWYTLEAFLTAYDDLEIILVLPAEHLQTGRTLVAGMGAEDRIRLVAGGATRYHSVGNGLQLIRDGLGAIGDGPQAVQEESVVFVHDGVRCLVSRELVRRCHEQTLRLGSAIPVVDCKDSVRMVVALPGGAVAEARSEAVDRNLVKLVQTPQTFLSSLLLPSYQMEYREAFTDEATVVEAAGHSVHLIEGEINNIKITTPADLAVAGELLSSGGGGF
jgi:2-C-methyl-D-erythritol 4-phosphate cytidylyltransferase